jgi:Zn-dependent alcohol dehydrogenase
MPTRQRNSIYVKYYKDGKFPLERMISQVYPLEEINKALSELENGCSHRVLIRMDYSLAN